MPIYSDRRRRLYVAAIVSCLAFGSSTVPTSIAVAQSTERVIVDVTNCMDIESNDRKLACYERSVAQRKVGEPGPSPRSTHSAAADEPQPRQQGEKPQQTDPSDDLVATIAALEETVPRTYLITLDNGQIWRQMYAQTYRLRPGMEVKIYSSNRGSSHRLSATRIHGFIQVERVR